MPAAIPRNLRQGVIACVERMQTKMTTTTQRGMHLTSMINRAFPKQKRRTMKHSLKLLATLLVAPMAALMAAEPITIDLAKRMDVLTPSVIMNPGAEFQDEARPGGMIIGMDRTPNGRIWGCWPARRASRSRVSPATKAGPGANRVRPRPCKTPTRAFSCAACNQGVSCW